MSEKHNKRDSLPSSTGGSVAALCCAVIFLTRIPLPFNRPMEGQQPLLYFPLVGLFIGILAAAVFYSSNLYWPQPVAVLLSVGVTLLCTGALHEDGLADTADGMGGGWSVEDKLRIMKDSSIGTYGALALIFALLLKLAALSTMQATDVIGALIVAHVLSRWSALPLLRYCVYVGGGSAAAFADINNRKRFVIACVYTPIIVLLVAPEKGLLALFIALLVTFASYRYFRSRLGGVTGDSLGATNQIVEIAIYLTFLAVSPS
ncbi:MAG: adenosylcobinamide-GDP ribazoletransferase [Halioglobus sp.]|jgi:adenosylcobinamide-GDP ribazoletransferase